MASQQAQGIVADCGARTEQHHRNGLMRNAIVARDHQIAAGGDEAQAAILDRERTAFQIQQPMPVGVGQCGRVPDRGGLLASRYAGRSSSMPKPNAAMSADTAGEQTCELLRLLHRQHAAETGIRPLDGSEPARFIAAQGQAAAESLQRQPLNRSPPASDEW